MYDLMNLSIHTYMYVSLSKLAAACYAAAPPHMLLGFFMLFITLPACGIVAGRPLTAAAGRSFRDLRRKTLAFAGIVVGFPGVDFTSVSMQGRNSRSPS